MLPNGLEARYQEIERKRKQDQEEQVRAKDARRKEGGARVLKVVLTVLQPMRRSDVQVNALQSFRQPTKAEWASSTAKWLMKCIGGKKRSGVYPVMLKFSSGETYLLLVLAANPHQHKFSEHRVQYTSPQVMICGNSQGGALFALPTADEASLSTAVHYVIGRRISGIEGQERAKAALRRIQKQGILAPPAKKFGTTQPGYREEDEFNMSGHLDAFMGQDFNVTYMRGCDYVAMPWQIKSSNKGLEEHRKRFSSTPAIRREKSRDGHALPFQEEVTLNVELTLLAMDAYAQDSRIVLMIDGDPVATVLKKLVTDGIIKGFSRNPRFCNRQDHRHAKPYLWYECVLPDGSEAAFTVFAAGWQNRVQAFAEAHPRVPRVLLRAAPWEEILKDIETQVLGLIQPKREIS